MDRYVRKVSVTEARGGFLLVEKRSLSFFPPTGEPFDLDGRESRVETLDCTCRGPDKPHSHWIVRVPGLAADDRVVIERTAEGWRSR